MLEMPVACDLLAITAVYQYGCRYLKITRFMVICRLLMLFQIPILTAVVFPISDYSQSSTDYGFIGASVRIYLQSK